MQMKACSSCHVNKPLEDFPVNKTKPLGRGYNCRACHSEYVNRHYAMNVDAYLNKAKRRRIESRDYVKSIKNSLPCVDCGQLYPNEPWLKDFDHVSEKKFNVAHGHSRGVKAIKNEIAKCQIVCLICHRRRTAKRAGWRPC